MARGNLHTAFRHGILYADSFLRLSNRQRYFMIVSKYIRPKLPPFPLLGNYPDVWHQHKCYSISDDYVNRLKSDIERHLRLPGAATPLWHTASDPKMIARSYRQTLNKKMSAYMAGDISGLWDENESNTETKCNYQRFYLFDVVLAHADNRTSWVFRLINDWIDLYPPARNSAWDSFNCAVRLLNWVRLLHDAESTGFPEKEQWEKILRSIHLQLLCVRHGHKYEVPGNHVVIELFALWLLSAIFTDLEEAKTWEAYAWKKLSEEIDAQFLASGFHCEYSVHYHVQVTLVALFWLCASEALGVPVPAMLRRKLNKTCTLIRNFLLSDGSLALFGDGCFPFFHETLHQDIENIDNLASRAFPAAVSDDAGPGEHAATDLYPYILATNEFDKLIADVGNLGLRNNPGHGHSDLLSFVYCSRGVPVMIDPGTRAYANDPACLQLKKAAYHNTISLDGADHAQLWGYFRWAFLPEDPTYALKSSANEITLEAQFTGSKHIGGLRHKRVFCMKADELLIDDTVSVTGSHDLSMNFILHPHIIVTPRDNRSLILVTGTHRWIFSYAGTAQPVITVSPIQVYMEYGQPTATHKIEVACGLDGDVFASRITLCYQSPDRH